MSSITNNSLSPVFEVTTATPGSPPPGDAGFSDLFGQVLASSSSAPQSQEPVPPAETQETAGADEQEEGEQQDTTTEQSSSADVNTESQASEETEEPSEDAVEISEEAVAVATNDNAEVTEVAEVIELAAVAGEEPADESVETPDSNGVSANSEGDAKQQDPGKETPEIHEVARNDQNNQPELATGGSVQEIPSQTQESSGQQSVVHSKTPVDSTEESSPLASAGAVKTKEKLSGKEEVAAEEPKAESAQTEELKPEHVQESLPGDEYEQHEDDQPRRKPAIRNAPARPQDRPSAEVVDKAPGLDLKASVESEQPIAQPAIQTTASTGTELAASSTSRAGIPTTATEAPSVEAELRETPTVDRNRFLGRVSGAFKAAQQRDGRIQVRLSPPELGLLRIELSVQQGSLTASLETETNAARNLILENLPVLKERLAEQDIRIETFDVDVREEGREAPDHELARERRSQQAGRSRRAGIKTDRAEPTDQQPQEVLAAESFSESDQGLDIRV